MHVMYVWHPSPFHPSIRDLATTLAFLSRYLISLPLTSQATRYHSTTDSYASQRLVRRHRVQLERNDRKDNPVIPNSVWSISNNATDHDFNAPTSTTFLQACSVYPLYLVRTGYLLAYVQVLRYYINGLPALQLTASRYQLRFACENITGYLKNHWTKHRHVCTHSEAFFMPIPNMDTEM